MNFGDSKNSELIKFMGINQSTFYDKLKRKSFTPNELEKIAEFFKRPISYYFDRDEPDQLNEKEIKYVRCLECEKKQEEINKLNKDIREVYEKYTKCLEDLNDLKGGNPNANSTQYRQASNE